MNLIPKEFYKPSKTPVKHIAKIAYKGQNPDRMRFKDYQDYMANLPILDNDSPRFGMTMTNHVMRLLTNDLLTDTELMTLPVEDTKFKRTIIAIEPPTITQMMEHGAAWVDVVDKENAELVVAHWGDGFTSPIHGHSTGFLYERVLTGKMLVYNYRIVNLKDKIVRNHSMQTAKPGVFVSEYTPHNEDNMHDRQTLVHNFKAIGRSNTLHFLPEHTRDGRDNRFKLETWNELDGFDVRSVTAAHVNIGAKIGDIFLVRSHNVPEYGDHFIVITGPLVNKTHGRRRQDVQINASENDTKVLNAFLPKKGVTILELDAKSRESFLEFHDITVEDNKVILPKY